jgi:hypothetical protein
MISVSGRQIMLHAQVTPQGLQEQDLKDYKFGFIQFVFQASYTAFYKNKGNPYKKLSNRLTRLPSLDGDGDSELPFYGRGLSALQEPNPLFPNQPVGIQPCPVVIEDKPQLAVPLTTKDAQGTLARLEGTEAFKTWLVVYNSQTEHLICLAWHTWGFHTDIDEGQVIGGDDPCTQKMASGPGEGLQGPPLHLYPGGFTVPAWFGDKEQPWV